MPSPPVLRKNNTHLPVVDDTAAAVAPHPEPVADLAAARPKTMANACTWTQGTATAMAVVTGVPVDHAVVEALF